jgi:hypothetical protein
MKDYYSILKLTRLCNDIEIKKSYRNLAFIWHPDKNKSAQASQRFIEIHEAYEILIDPVKRKLYDFLNPMQEILDIRTQKSQEQKTQFAEFEKEAIGRGKYFAAMSFKKLQEMLSNVFVVTATVIEILFIGGWGIFFVVLSIRVAGMVISALADYDWNNFVMWRIVVGIGGLILLSLCSLYIGYRLLKKVSRNL